MHKSILATAAVIALGTVHPAQAQTVLSDNTPYADGSYVAYITSFNKGWLLPDKDFTNKITIKESTFPNGTVIQSNWPETPCPLGIFNFNAIDFGNYFDTLVRKPVPSRRIKDIKEVSENHALSLSGESDGFDVIDQMFLTARAGNLKTRVAEIDVFVHTPTFSAAYAADSTAVGTFEGGGIKWTATIDKKNSPPVVMFQPFNRADVLSGTVELGAMLKWLVTKGTLSGDEWFNGMAFGMQTNRGHGSITLDTFHVSFK